MKTASEERVAHTPTPWEVKFIPEMNQFFISALPTEDHAYKGRTRFIEVMSDEEYPRKQADAEFIVTAVNAHEALVDALRLAYDRLEHTFCLGTSEDKPDVCHCGILQLKAQAYAALKLAAE